MRTRARSEEIVERCRRIEGRGLRTFVDEEPLVWERASGWTIEDADGNLYVDLYGGFAVAAIGHGHPRVVEAIRRQAEDLAHCPSAHPSPVRAEFLEALASIAPSGFNRIIPAVTGAMANEMALAIARTRRPGRVVTFSGSYFGRSAGVVGLAGKARYRVALGIGASGEFAPFPYPLLMGTGALDETMAVLYRIASGDGPISAVITEPIQGNGGVVIPPRDFLPRLRSFCDDVSALLIVDEIQSGCGRTGRMWALEHSGARPDLVTAGKGIGGGLPVAAVLGNDEIMTWPPDAYTSTFLTNNVTLAAAIAAIHVLRDDDLARRAAALGPGMRDALVSGLRLPCVAEVRTIGLWAGVELVDEGGFPSPSLAGAAVRAARRRGVVVGRGGYYDNVVKLSPPLVIDEDALSEGIAALCDAIAETSERRRR